VDWFKSRPVPSLAQEWTQRFIVQWAEGTGTPARLREPEIVTNQFGIAVGQVDMEHPDFKATLELYIEIAVEAVTQAARPKQSNWDDYDTLTA